MIRVRTRSSILLAGLMLLGCTPAPPDGIALVGATLLDGSGGPPLRDAVIVVRRSRIESVGTRSGFELPRNTREVDVTGRWIIPGLIDAHAHLAPAVSWAPSRYLAWGVTTVREVHGGLNAVVALRKRLNGAAEAGPRVFASGAMIDGMPTTYPDAIGVSNEKDARKAVDRLVNAGVDLIQVYTRIDQPLLRVIMDEAKAFSMGVTAHLGMVDAVTAAKAGVLSIEQLTGVPEAASHSAASLYTAHYRGFLPGWTASERSWADLDSASLARVAAQLVAAKVTVIPTLVLHEAWRYLNDPAPLRDPNLKDVPEAQRNEWDIPGMISRAGWTDADFAAFQRSGPKQDLFVRVFVAGGGRIAAGTDATNQLLVPGYSEHREMELLVRAGLTPRQALRAATRNGAVLLGADSLGLLAQGKVADLIVLARDPLVDIRNTRAIKLVMSRGRLMDPDSIRQTW